jgi:hypothetical protein
MMKLTQDGNFTQLPPTYNTHKIMGGMWADKTEAQHQQMLRALKGEHYRIFEMKWKI